MKRLNQSIVLFLILCVVSVQVNAQNEYTQRFLTMYDKIYDEDNGYFSADGVPYHSIETLMCEAPDYGHETTSEAYSYWIWLDVMYGGITGDWTALQNSWDKMEQYAIPTDEMQPTTADLSDATFAGEYEEPSYYPAALESDVPVGEDPMSPDLTDAYGSNIYGMHWLFDCDNIYGYGNMGDGTSTPSYINTFQRGEQESVWETVTHPSWETFNWGSDDGTGFLKLFIDENGNAPSKQWRYTNAPDADARVVQAMYWALQFANEQDMDASELPLEEASKMGDFLRLAMCDKYFRPIGVQDKTSAGGEGYESVHYLLSWYYAWGGPLVSNNWAWRIGCSIAHFGYQNPVAAYALSEVEELQPISENGVADWSTSLERQLEFYTWLQSDEGAIAGGATNSYNGQYEEYPDSLNTFYDMAYVENPVYHDPGSNTWFGMQAWSMERIAELYYINENEMAKDLLEKWIPWAMSEVQLSDDGTFEIPSTISWKGQPNTWDADNPEENTDLHVIVENYAKDLGIAACLAKTFIYYAAATEKYDELDTDVRDMAKEILDRMWDNYYEEDGAGVAVEEERSDYTRFFEQEVYIPEDWTGTMANGDTIQSGVTFLDIRSFYKEDPDFEALEEAYYNGETYTDTYHRFWAQVDIALANAEYGRFFSDNDTIYVTGVTVDPESATVSIDGTVELTTTVSPSTATVESVTWSSSDESIATVDEDGVVTGVAEGTATITATTVDGGYTADCEITVVDEDVYTLTITIEGEGEVEVSPEGITFVDGTEITLTAVAADDYIFESWSGDVSDSTETITITMDSDKEITATFTEDNECDFDLPLSTPLPSINSSYSYVYVIGDGPDLSNVTNFTINWDLDNNGLYQLSMTTNDGSPEWWNDLSSEQSNTFSSSAPTITLNGTDFDGLDGSYYAGLDDDNLVLESISDGYIIYFSNSSTSPCPDVKTASNTTGIAANKLSDVKVYPNPFNDELIVDANGVDQINSIQILNTVGQVVYQQNDVNSSSAVSVKFNGASGIYILKVQAGNNTIIKQISKQ